MSNNDGQGHEDQNEYVCQLVLDIDNYNAATKKYQTLVLDYLMAKAERDLINIDIDQVLHIAEVGVSQLRECKFGIYKINSLVYDFQATEKSLETYKSTLKHLGNKLLEALKKI